LQVETDYRMWSTTPRLLFSLNKLLLDGGMPNDLTVREFQLTLRQHNIYPARDAPGYCIPDPPDAFFTYHSAQSVIDIETIVVQTCKYAARMLKSRRPELAGEDLALYFYDHLRIWVDFLFINQAARDIREELNVLPRLLEGVKAHFVLGTQPLMRAWCCYELALFNQHLVGADSPSSPQRSGPRLRSLIAPTRSFHLGWEHTQATEPEDKAFIGERIQTTFPLGFEGFNRVMSEANSVAVLPLAEYGVWSTPTADEGFFQAVEAWYERSRIL
jgi:hypothetical protein